MKFRKGLISAATAVAVATTGVAVANAAENTDKAPVVQAQGQSQTPEKKKLDPAEVSAWIGVASAIIGLLGTIFAFYQKYLQP